MYKYLGLIIFCFSASCVAAPDNTIINNNNNVAPAQNGCGNNTSNNGPYIPSGSYHAADGSTNYTTGNKQPYIVDNGCNTQAQPYVYAQPPSNGIMPGPVGPVNRPGLRR